MPLCHDLEMREGSDAYESSEVDLVSDRIPIWPRRLWIYASIFILVLIILVFTFMGLWISEKQASPCITPDCLEASSRILQSLDTSVPPCQDFYQFACNGWKRQNPIPYGQNQISLVGQMDHRNLYLLKEVMENSSSTDKTRGFRLAQTYYNSCVAEDAIEDRKLIPLLNQIKNLYHGWALITEGVMGSRTAKQTKFELHELLKPTLKYFGSSFLFDLSIYRDLENSSNVIIYIGSGAIGQPKEYYESDDEEPNSDIKEAYVEYMKTYSEMLGVPKANLSKLEEVYEFEKLMAQNTEDRTDSFSPDNYKFVPLKDLNSSCSVLNWYEFLGAIFGAINYDVKLDERIGVAGMDFLLKRCQVIQTYMDNEGGMLTLHNAAIWLFLSSTLKWMPESVQMVRGAHMIVTEGVVVDKARWEECLEVMQEKFGPVIGRKFVEKVFSEKDKESVTNLVDIIKDVFKEVIMSQDWMDPADKQKAVQKTVMKTDRFFENSLAIYEASVIDDQRELVTRDVDKWYSSPDTVNAYYDFNKNSMKILGGLLQRPFYYSNYPVSLNMGSLGMIIGHEITHGFDDNGSKFDANGNRRELWSKQTRQEFEERARCMVEQYSNYSIHGKNLNGEFTLDENIADAGGLKSSYVAFKALLRDIGNKPKLPSLDYTPEQLFFISFGQFYCLNSLREFDLNQILTNSHTINYFRVNGAVSNFAEFSEAFECPLGSPMNPTNKCGIW